MKIGLALSGGGVLGIAHFGVLKQLEEKGIKIDAICGTSAGAIIGALFAAGGTAKINDFIADIEKQGLFDPKRFIFNLNPDKIFMLVRSSLVKHLPEKFYDLRVRFSCLATDIDSGRGVLLSKGNLIDSIMASAAYPGVFPPQKLDGLYLMDGGIAHNLPAKFSKEMGVDFVIGSSLYSISTMEKLSTGKALNRFELSIRALDIMQKELAEREIEFCDFCFMPPVEFFRWFNFDKMNEIKLIGENHASDHVDSLIKSIDDKRSKGGFWQHLLHLRR